MMKVLIWFPVILYPATNVILAIQSGSDYTVTSIIPWILGAVAEELFFRLFLLKTILLPRVKPMLAILVTAILFAGMHLLNLRTGAEASAVVLQCFCAFCFSIWAGAVVWRKGSIIIPLLAHVLLNATAITEGTLIPVLANVVVLIDGILLMKGNGYEQQR